ncbi:MAG: FliH/SctL family protein, partial [Limnochordales bacterium]
AAEHRGRDPRIAGAMVDASIVIEGVVGEGEILTLSAQQARELGFADFIGMRRAEVLEEARREGYQAGQAEGRRAGAEAVRAEAAARLDALAAVVNEVGRVRDELAARYEDDIVELALAVAARIVRRESAMGPDTVRTLLRETLPRTGGATNIKIVLHPEDLAVLEQDARQLASLTDGRAGVSWEADERVARGGCHVETERGGIDASVETRVRRIVEAMIGVITGGG